MSNQKRTHRLWLGTLWARPTGPRLSAMRLPGQLVLISQFNWKMFKVNKFPPAMPSYAFYISLHLITKRPSELWWTSARRPKCVDPLGRFQTYHDTKVRRHGFQRFQPFSSKRLILFHRFMRKLQPSENNTRSITGRLCIQHDPWKEERFFIKHNRTQYRNTI